MNKLSYDSQEIKNKIEFIINFIVENRIQLEHMTKVNLTAYAAQTYGRKIEDKILKIWNDPKFWNDQFDPNNNSSKIEVPSLLNQLKNEGINSNDFGIPFKFNPDPNYTGINTKVSQTAIKTTFSKNKSAKSVFELVEDYLKDKYKFRLNVITNDIEFCLIDKNEFENLNIDNLYVELQKMNYRFSRDNLKSLLRSSFISQYDPFAEYFTNLREWDGKTDHIEILCSYLKLTDLERFKIQFKKMLVRTVACSMYGSINKNAFILVQNLQNSGKTWFLNWLCPKQLKQYLSINLTVDKDGLIALCENFIINLDELASLSKYEINHLKSVFSLSNIKVRPPYGDKAIPMRRRASFVGSTNNLEFLTDVTGNVRWICFELSDRINWDYEKVINIDDIWAQAFSLYHSGYKYELTRDEIEENERVNKSYMIHSLEMELVSQYFTFDESRTNFLKTEEVLKLLNEKTEFRHRLNIREIGRALQFNGIKRESKYFENIKMSLKGYYIKQFKF